MQCMLISFLPENRSMRSCLILVKESKNAGRVISLVCSSQLLQKPMKYDIPHCPESSGTQDYIIFNKYSLSQEAVL